MAQNSSRTNPLIVIAATTLILTCLLAIGVMTGLVPSPLNRDRDAVQDNISAPAHRSALNESHSAKTPASGPRSRTTDDRSPVGATSSASPSNSVAGGDPAPKVAAVCMNCGTVTSVRVVKQQGEAGLVGPIAGGALGGVIGSQIGGGSGKTLATIAGAAGGAAIGTEVERRSKSTSHYVVGVRLNDGTTRSFTYQAAPGVQEGDKVKVVEGRLVRDS